MELFGRHLTTETEIDEKCVIVLVEEKIFEFDVSMRYIFAVHINDGI
jgi:hypothetical protein